MALPAPIPKIYFVKQGAEEKGPLTVAQLNQMRAQNEIAATDLCRAADSGEFLPLGTMFPHMADFVRKPLEQIQSEAREMEAGNLANSALVCGVVGLSFGGLILGVFAVVLGMKAWLRAQSIKGVIGALIGGLAFLLAASHVLKPYRQE